MQVRDGGQPAQRRGSAVVQPVSRVERLGGFGVGRERDLVGAQDPRKVELCSQRGDLVAVQAYGADRRRASGCSIRSRRVGAETLRRPELHGHLGGRGRASRRAAARCRRRGRRGAHCPRAVGLPAALSAPMLHRALGLDLQQRSPARAGRRRRAVVGDDSQQRLGEFSTAGGDVGCPPVAVAGRDGVVEGVGPVLQLEVGPVGSGAPRRVDPGPRRPAGAGPHQRGVQRAVGVDGEARARRG